MVAELSSVDKQALTEFFTALTSLNGSSVAESIMRFSHEPPGEAKAREFTAAMEGVFANLDEAKMRLNTQHVIAQMLEAIRQNGISLRDAVSTVVVTAMILEGWSTKLHPDIRILDSIREMLPGKWSDRVCRAVDSMVGSGWMIDTV
jgi:aarF domain-containing kinase